MRDARSPRRGACRLHHGEPEGQLHTPACEPPPAMAKDRRCRRTWRGGFRSNQHARGRDWAERRSVRAIRWRPPVDRRLDLDRSVSACRHVGRRRYRCVDRTRGRGNFVCSRPARAHTSDDPRRKQNPPRGSAVIRDLASARRARLLRLRPNSQVDSRNRMPRPGWHRGSRCGRCFRQCGRAPLGPPGPPGYHASGTTGLCVSE